MTTQELLRDAAAALRRGREAERIPLIHKLEAVVEKMGEPIEFTCHGSSAPAYSCNKPGDRSGTYYLAPPPAVPEWKDPYTNNGDSTSVTDYRHGWNACRDAMLATTKEQGHE